MNLTAVLWFLIFVSLIVASFRRPVYACAAYLMTFFLAPPFWWWGAPLTSITMRWSLLGAIVLLIVVLAQWGKRATLARGDRAFFVALFLFVVNAFLIHSLNAANPDASSRYFDVLWKSCGLAFLIRACLKNLQDLEIFLFSIVLMMAYIGYAVVFDGAGTTINGRLEGVGIPNASGANGVAALSSLALIFCSYFVMASRSIMMRVTSLISAPFILDLVLRCNSRGAFLGLIVAGVWMSVAAKGKTRVRVIALICLGGIAILIQAGDARIWERFQSTFAEAEDRDNSAGERLLYWKAALQMISDHPLGSGGKAAFESELGASYIAFFRNGEFRSVHNGFLDLAAGWGVQGFTLFGFALGIAFFSMLKASRRFSTSGDHQNGFLGVVLQTTLVSQLICTMFTSIMDGEWYLWLASISLAYSAERQVAMQHGDGQEANSGLNVNG